MATKWEYHKIYTNESRKGWPIYLYPVLFVEYEPEVLDEEYGDGFHDKYESFLTIGFGVKFLGYSRYWYIMRRITDTTQEE